MAKKKKIGREKPKFDFSGTVEEFTDNVKVGTKTFKGGKETSSTREVQQRGTPAGGATPEFRTTVQGDRFDINLPITKEDFSSPASFKQATSIKGASGVGGFLDTRQQAGAGVVAEQRAEPSKEFLEPFEELRGELQEKILEKPSLEPQPLAEKGAAIGLTPAVAAGNLILDLGEKVTGKKFGDVTAEELAKTKAGKALGFATAGVGIALAGYVAYPYVAALGAKLAIFGGVTGATGSATGLRIAAEAITIGFLGKAGLSAVFDIRGAEIDKLRTELQKVVEDGERIEAAHRNGFPVNDTIELLTTMADEVSFAESTIKQLASNNIQYRVSKEYTLDSQRVRSAREAIERRVGAVINTELTGKAALDPGALMFQASQIAK